MGGRRKPAAIFRKTGFQPGFILPVFRKYETKTNIFVRRIPPQMPESLIRIFRRPVFLPGLWISLPAMLVIDAAAFNILRKNKRK